MLLQPLFFFYVIILQFKKVKSQNGQLQKDSLGKNNERTLTSEFSNLAQKWLKIVFANHCWWVLVKISSSIQLFILGGLAEGGSVAVAVGVSDMWEVTHNTWQVTPETWLFVLVLLSALVERFSGSRMRNFSYCWYTLLHSTPKRL